MENSKSVAIATAGIGIKDLLLGASAPDVKRTLGKPDTARTYSDEIWWSFFDRGIDCGFNKTDKTLIALNFFREGIAGHKQATVATENGLSPGIPKPVVLQRLGAPTESDDGWTDRLGKWHRGWIKYASGIAFEFGHDNKVDVMTVYAPSE